jgi:hypothetical protein
VWYSQLQISLQAGIHHGGSRLDRIGGCWRFGFGSIALWVSIMKSTAVAFAASLLLVTAASAANYPISGKWAYDGSSGPGPTECRNHSTIEFAGDRRFETGGKAPSDYRNVSVEHTGKTTYRIVDRFFTGMQNGKVAYTLRLVDTDHIEIKHERGGATFGLRSCN